MREILFRGKRKDNGEWVEGIPITTHIGTFIVFEENPHFCGQYGYMEIDELAKVDPETVGQFTGLRDCKRTKEYPEGQMIFEGDIVKVRNDSYFVVCYGEYFPKFYCEAIKDVFGMVPDCMHVGLFGGSIKTGEEVILTNCTHLYEVIGNIHDNPELLKGSGKE